MFNSSLYNEDTFYNAFIKDILSCRRELIIESPFITTSRVNMLLPYFRGLLQKRVKIIIITRSPSDLENKMANQTYEAIKIFKDIGIKPYYCGKHHRKLAIIDREILYEGSLNILSYSYSSELMRKIEGRIYAMEMLNFTNLDKIV